MRVAAFVLIAAMSVPAGSFVSRLMRDTNSRAVTRKATTEFEGKKYDAAVADFRTASALAPGSESGFNLGTSLVGAGKFEQGSEILTPLTARPEFAANAFYNRGYSALGASAYDYAIRDYIEALKLDPSDKDAKRNLEIALKKKEQQQQRQQGGGGSQPQPQPNQNQGQSQQKPEPNQQQSQPAKKNETEAEALLRAAEEQEKEEMSRLRKAKAAPEKIGW